MKFSKEKQVAKKKKGINLFKQKTWRQLVKEIDAVVSLKVRERDGWECQKCHVIISPPTRMMQCSHYWNRDMMGTRWDMDNLIALCYSCHQRVEKRKHDWYRDFMIRKLGQEKYDLLEIRAKAITKFSKSDLETMLLVEELKGNV